MSTPLERLLAETIPVRPAPAPYRSGWTREQQDMHWAELCEVAGTPGAKRPTRTTLRLITHTAA